MSSSVWELSRAIDVPMMNGASAHSRCAERSSARPFGEAGQAQLREIHGRHVRDMCAAFVRAARIALRLIRLVRKSMFEIPLIARV